MKTVKDYLRDHSKAVRDIELTEAAIGILEGVNGCSGIVQQLKRKQQSQLRRIDKAALVILKGGV